MGPLLGTCCWYNDLRGQGVRKNLAIPSFRGSGENLQVLLQEEGVLCWNDGPSSSQKTERGGKWVPLLDLGELAEGEGRKLCLWLSLQYPFMGGETLKLKKVVNLPGRYLKGEFGKDIVFFGGSFNPWHRGHDACLSLCPQGPVLVLPDQNPWKERVQFKCPFYSFQQLALKLEPTPHSIYPGFMALGEGNPTCHWISKVEVAQRYFLMGDDVFLSLNGWKRWTEVVEQLQGIFVCPRQASYGELTHQEERLKQVKPSLEIVLLDHHQWESQSSTFLRDKEKKG